ncbi:MAG: patatin-like phospholipase family protein [Myxococcales bacterium]|nr:patatin-like phospholipase family protein [Myxococcales bacterium]MCB9540780.1 patatin-like phospholipase family protein [Myxococcales bacterium]
MPNCGLVLAGGGARGAYEAGILYYLFVDGPAELREAARFNVLCGTSIGALNISAVAASIHQPSVGIRRLAELWRGVELDHVLQIGLTDMMALPGWIMGRNRRDSVFPGEPVWKLLNSAIDWDRIHVNLAEGHLNAVSISCTQVPTGKTTVFYETADGRPRKFSRDPHVRPVYARLGPQHALASAAIPFVFPAVPIDGIPYADGGLRQNTPLSPALRLGSNRLLVCGMGHEKPMDVDEPIPDWRGRLSSPVFLLAKVLNALMLDHVDYDLIRLGHVNRLLADGGLAFGEQFVTRLNQMVAPIRGARYRIVPNVVLRPSHDLGKMAAAYVRSGEMRGARGMTSRVIRTLARMESRDEADLTSYLLFDGPYCDKLINLGIEDARQKRDELIRLFTAPTDASGTLT